MKPRLPAWVQYGSKLLVAYVMVGSFIAAPAVVHHYAAYRQATVSAEALQTAVDQHQPNAADVSLGTPVSITFVRQQVTLSMSKGIYNSELQTWIVSGKDAEWIKAADSLHNNVPNGPGIIYGHALPQVLAVSLKPVPNDTVIVTYTSGKHLAYMFARQQTVLPTDTSVLNGENPRSLAVITCQGMFNQYRHIGFYEYIGAVQ